jgi:peptidoglycan/xylan/chitin deacetylase (PgdA/CDA1 family)
MTPTVAWLGSRLLGWPPVIYNAPGHPAAVALTFDDGPSRWTAEIAAALEQHECRGTFFIRGAAVAERPSDVAALAGAGHQLGNHLWSHSDPARQSRAELRDELERTAEAIRDAAGVAPRIARPPYCGAPGAVARAAAGGRADAIVLRNVDPADWNAESADEVFEDVISKIGPGDIVCLHDGVVPGTSGKRTRDATAAAVARLVPALLERGLRPVTVAELLG